MSQLGKQALAVGVVALYAFGVTYLLGKLINRAMGFRVSAEEEIAGVDLSLHAESAYEHAVLAHGGPVGGLGHHPGPGACSRLGRRSNAGSTGRTVNGRSDRAANRGQHTPFRSVTQLFHA